MHGLLREVEQGSKSAGEDEEHPRKKPGNAKFEVSPLLWLKNRKSLFLLFLLFLWIGLALLGGSFDQGGSYQGKNGGRNL